jgi:hypothetical protein
LRCDRLAVQFDAHEIRSGEDDDDRLFVVGGDTRGRSGVGGLSLGNIGARAGVTDSLLERSNSTPLADRISRQAGG